VVLLEVRTSDESCFNVCVKLRDASARARVSRMGRVSHVSQPTQPVPQPGGDDDVVEDVVVVVVVVAGSTLTVTGFLGTSGDGDLVAVGVGVGVGSVFSGAFNMADNPPAGSIPDTPLGCCACC